MFMFKVMFRMLSNRMKQPQRVHYKTMRKQCLWKKNFKTCCFKMDYNFKHTKAHLSRKKNHVVVRNRDPHDLNPDDIIMLHRRLILEGFGVRRS